MYMSPPRRYPIADARAKLHAEVDRVLGRRMPTSRELDALVYTEQIVNETLRLYSPIHSISRVALVDDTLGGYHIPAGATIYVSLHATHRLARLWPDPDRFDPDRFTPERKQALRREVDDYLERVSAGQGQPLPADLAYVRMLAGGD